MSTGAGTAVECGGIGDLADRPLLFAPPWHRTPESRERARIVPSTRETRHRLVLEGLAKRGGIEFRPYLKALLVR